jgi:hypothetical protein
MLVRIFKKSHWYSPLLLLFIAALLWMDAFLYPERAIDTISGPGNAFYEMVFPLMTAYPRAAVTFAFILLMMQVYMINYVATSKEFTDRYSALPGLTYLLLMCSTAAMIAPHPVLFANAFLIPAVNKLLNAYENEQIAKQVFNIGFLIAMASLFFLPALAFFPVLIVSVIIYYIVNLRRIIASFLGLFTPYFFLSLYYFMKTASFLPPDMMDIDIHPLGIFYLDVNIYEQVFIVVLSLLSFFSILRLQLVYKGTKPIRIRKRITMLIIILLFSVLSYVMSNDNIQVHFGMVMVSLSIALSVFFFDIRKRRFTEILFGLFVLLTLAGRFSDHLLY